MWRSKPSLWGIRQPQSFCHVMTTLTLYHDLKGVGWQQISKVTQVLFKLVHSSLSHNAKAIRRILNEWALLHIKPGSRTNWSAAARNVQLPKDIKDATLVIDSFDLPIQKVGKKRGPKSPYWSRKMNKPGWRYMLIMDIKCHVQYVSSGYSPKVYDGHWL